MNGLLLLAAVVINANAALAPADLRCEYTQAPLGIDVQRPRLSWALASTGRGEIQSGYQILVASSEGKLRADQGDLWDSGKVQSNATLHVEYCGAPLKSGQRCWWKVRVWDKGGEPSPYSEPSWWEMALLTPQDWGGKWISGLREPDWTDEQRYGEHPAPLLRKDFQLKGQVVRARAYVTGLGYYELHLNGQKVGDAVLDPGWTTYSKRVLYSTYDVTPLLREGRNAAGIMLGNGWYNPLPLRMWGKHNLRKTLTVGQPRAILQLNIEYADGTVESIVTDESWQAGAGPIVKNNIYLGEVYDARREQPGWTQPSFEAVSWKPVALADEPLGPLQAQACPPIRSTATVKPIARTEPKPGVYIFDLGQNFAGWVRLRASGPAGTAVKMRFGEVLHADGKLNVMTSVCGQIKQPGLGGPGAPDVAYASDTYILKGEGEETYTPRFTFHGFRYVEVTSYPGVPPMDAIEGHRLCSDIKPVGSFSCSNELFNQIQQMCLWTQQSNMFSVQSDCPHRERFSYGGDIAAASELALYNFDMSQFYVKTVLDMHDAARGNGGFTETNPYMGIADSSLGEGSGPIDWGTAHPLLLLQLYQYYGNRRLMEEQYETARRWIALLEQKATDDLLDNGLGDHETIAPKDVPLTGSAFYYYNVYLTAEVAQVLGKDDEVKRLTALANRIKDAINRKFLQKDSGKYGAGTQACQSFVLFMDLMPKEYRTAVLDALVADVKAKGEHLSTGIFGTKYLLNALSDNGRPDLAYAIANQRTFPGWGYMLAGGATTLWEHWEGSDNTYSHNHPMFGPVSEWFYKVLGGIRPDPAAVGFDKIIIAPQIVGDLTWVRADYNSIRGRVSCHWRREDGAGKPGNSLLLEVTIPPNTTATVHVPREPAAQARDVAAAPRGGRKEPVAFRITESGKPVEQAEGVTPAGRTDTTAIYRIGSGTYRFEVSLKRP